WRGIESAREREGAGAMYRQLILRLPDDLSDRMHNGINKESLDGVEFVPVEKDGRRFTFTMEGDSYPARLVDLPCILETHKTLDRATYFKSGDVGQMLIVYEDERAYQRDEASCAVNPQGYYPDGMTPPTKNIVRRNFLKARPPHEEFSPGEVAKVESQVLKMMDDKGRQEKGAGAGGGGAGGGKGG
ncbi:unnamed protein product, partial [Discosporangium mesarthrocarpum]